MKLEDLPTIGQPWRWQELVVEVPIYAGLTIDKGVPAALVLLPGEFGEGLWKDATVWAKDQGGALPSRIDALVLFQNLKSKFKEATYWTSTPYAGGDVYTWCQYFDYGYQGFNRKDGELRARAVRRIAVT